MDVIPWAIGLVAGLTQPSLRRAIVIGVVASLCLRAYQYFLIDPRTWGDTMPEDIFGGIAMLALTTLFVWIGSIVRANRNHRQQVAS